MAASEWSPTERLDGEGDPIFLAPDGGLWAVSRSLGGLRQILERLRSGATPPWSMMERVGHKDDWTLAASAAGASASEWEEHLEWLRGRLGPLGERVDSHDWERKPGAVFRPRLDEARARALAEALAGRAGILVVAQPMLAALERQPESPAEA